jgi:L-glutamine---4-(methylsulfanyl)-2-oxobutanoate aminotransferase
MARTTPPAIARLPEQVFTRMLAAAAAARAAPGPDVIDLGRGNPDLPPPAVALEAAREAIAGGGVPVHGYPPFQGLPELREALCAHYAEAHGVTLDPDREVAVVPGTKTGIMLAVQAAAGEGDGVLLPDPGYPDYRSGVALAGAREVPLPLDGAAGWRPAWPAAGDGVALACLNYPSNPCAAAEPEGAFAEALRWCERHDAWLLNDLAYGFLTFDGRRGRSVLEEEGARERAVELWSPSKLFGMAGWRVGFLVGAAELVGRVRALVDHTTAGVWVAAQRGLLAAFGVAAEEAEHRRGVYGARREAVAGLPGLEPVEGTFYAWWRLPEGWTAERLIADARVVVADGAGFGARGAGWARLSLATGDAALAEGARRLREVAGG